MKKLFTALTLVFALSLASVVNVAATDSGTYTFTYTDVQELIISKMFSTFLSDQTNTSGVNELLDLLKATDADLGETYQGIMDYWKSATTMTVNKYNPLATDDPSGVYVPVDNTELSLPNISVTDDSELCIVILGYGLNSDGSMKNELYGRLLTGYALLQKYPDAVIAVTGGGTASNNPDATEAGQMADYLINVLGVPSSKVIQEDAAKNTAGNAINTMKILNRDYPSVKKLIMVTSDYHIIRGSTFFNTAAALYQRDTGKVYTIIGNCGYYTGKDNESVSSMLYSQMYTIADVPSGSSGGMGGGGFTPPSGGGNPPSGGGNPPSGGQGSGGQGSGSSTSLELTSIDAQNVTLEKGSQLTVKTIATFNEEHTVDVSGLVVISGYDENKVGEQEVTISYSLGETVKTDVITVTVTEKVVEKGPEDTPPGKQPVKTFDGTEMSAWLALSVSSLMLLAYISKKEIEA